MNDEITTVAALDETALIREQIRRGGLHAFIREFWDICEPGTPFVDGWYIGAICEALEAVFLRQILKLVINVPPGCGKTTITGICWPAWCWTEQPSHKFMFATYADKLGLVNARKCFDVLRSDRYRACWPNVEIVDERPQMADFRNTRGGRRMAVTPQGKATGMHANTQCVDDPIKADEVSEKKIEYISQWWRNTMSTRIDTAMPFARVIIMQRLRENDLAGEMLRDHGYEHLMFPLEYTPNASWDYGCSLGKLDQRTEPGESLNPALFSADDIEKRKAGLETPSAVAAQLDQNPTPPSGNIIEKAWLQKTWSTLGNLAGFRFIQAWDFAFKGKEASHSRVHGALWASCRGLFYLIDEMEPRHMSYVESKAAFKAQQDRPLWRRAALKYIEDKANGPAIMNDLANDVLGMQPYEPDGSKEERLIQHSPKFEAGLVLLPEQSRLSSVNDFREELIKFPRGRYDDRVDTTTMALDKLAGAAARMQNALKKWGGFA